jgi:hypothetical protein
LFENASLGPDDLKKVGQVFDETWEQIKSRYQDDPQLAELARQRLAESVLAAYRNGQVDEVRIKAHVLYWSG